MVLELLAIPGTTIAGLCGVGLLGKVIMYADNVTRSMERAITETYRRRSIQDLYNKEHNIVPKTIKKIINEAFVITKEDEIQTESVDMMNLNEMSKIEKQNLIKKLEKEMTEAAKALNFEQAMSLRDIIYELKAGM